MRSTVHNHTHQQKKRKTKPDTMEIFLLTHHSDSQLCLGKNTKISAGSGRHGAGHVSLHGAA